MTALNSLRETALHSACRSGSFECAQLLVIKYRLDVNAPNAYHETPLHLMADHSSEKLQKLMDLSNPSSRWKMTPRSQSVGALETGRAEETGSQQGKDHRCDHIHAPMARRQSERSIRYDTPWRSLKKADVKPTRRVEFINYLTKRRFTLNSTSTKLYTKHYF